MATTTSATLQQENAIKLGFVLAIEGIPLIFTDVVDTTAMKTAWSGSPWEDQTFIGGLKINASLKQSIDLFNPQIQTDSM